MSVDARYFYRELKEILGKLEYSTADEIARHLRMLADMAQPLDIEIPKRAEGETQGPSIHYAPAGYRYLAPEEVLAEGDMIDADDGEIRKASAIGLKVRQAACVRYIRAIQAPGEPKTGDPAREGKSLADRLHEFGYEPGGCMIHCFTCKQTAIADKRAIRCQACAMAKAEAPTPTGAREVDPEDVARYLHAIIGDRREESEPAVVEFLEDTPEAKEQGFTLWATKKAIEALAPAPRGTGEAG